MKTIIPIEIVDLEGESYHLLIKGLLNNGLECNLLIDTGASKTVFDRSLLADFSKHLDNEEKIKSAGINASPLDTSLAVISSLQIGDLVLNDFYTVFIDLTNINQMYEEFAGKKIWGLIGSDFLYEYQALIDYKNLTLTLNYKKSRKKKI